MVARVFCSAPFEVLHEDEPAVLTDECGMWTIERHWYACPVYKGYQAVTDARLITERVQIITLKDNEAPCGN
jgi:hypothetical protein